ncbi:MAG: metallophosphoesterase, partial [Myxococcales bacterium]|nr:metallophosphoesterase [Myxococcales bacterium]
MARNRAYHDRIAEVSRRSVEKSSNYIVFSDVHLGADLVQHVRPWTLKRLKQAARVDRDLCAMIDLYRAHADPEHPWRLVIAGDLVDFIGMSIAPEMGFEGELNDEEREYGLGSTEAQATAKMRAVAKRHGHVFEKLAGFVADGHAIALVRGNHDIDFHWASAQRAFIEALVDHRPELSDDVDARTQFEARVEFFPWFFYVEGLLYVEHGHQFDAMCSYHHLLAPVSPLDPRRICWSFSDLLLRQIVRPTPGVGSEGHESRGIADYVRFGVSLGIRGAAKLFYRYVSATLSALGRWRAYVGEKAAAIQREHERQLDALAGRMRIGAEKFRAIAALWPRPVTSGGLPVLRSMFIDRMLFLSAAATIVTVTGLLIPAAYWAPLSLGLLAMSAGYWVWSARARHRDVDPRVQMHLAASYSAKVLPSRYVVMGHTHEPVAERVADDVTYVNLGNWGVDDVDGPPGDEPPRTHLVLRWVGDRAEAAFLKWNPGEAPVPA